MARRKNIEESTCGPVGPNSTVRLCLTRDKEPISSKPINSPRDICDLLHQKGIGAADRESFYALHLDARNNVVNFEEIAKGTVASVDAHPREVFKGAILSNASALILAHNHPSGNPSPSEADKNLTRDLIAAGRIFQIPIMDHVIVTEKSCTSLRGDGSVQFLGAGLGEPQKKVRRSRQP